MIDTIRLNLTDCAISPNTPLIVESSPMDYSNKQEFIKYDLFCDTDGVMQQGKKAYLNTKYFNLEIIPSYSNKIDEQTRKHKKEELIWNKKDGGILVDTFTETKIEEEKFNSGIFVRTSLPRYNNDNNFNSLDPGSEKKVLKELEKDLRSNGIKCNIWDSYLSRVDTFTNIFTDENFYSYSNLFDVLEASRMEKFEFTKSTYLYKNSQRQICIYDKIEEMKNKNKDSTVYGFLPANVMRIENRYLNKRKIKNALQFYNLRDLYKNYDYLKENYKSDIETTIFKYDLHDVEIMTGNSIQEDMEIFYNSNSRQWLSNYLKMHGVASLLKLSNIETITEKINNIVDSDKNMKGEKKVILKNKRMIKSRIKKTMEKLEFMISSSKLSPMLSTKTNKDLYNELKTKFYKLVA